MLPFYATRSRVVRLHNLPKHADAFLAALFVPHNTNGVPVPASLWETMDGSVSGVFAVFRTHEEAAAALVLSGRAMSVDPVQESDLEPFHHLRRVHLPYTPHDYTLSTNPPNPKTAFRHGDWICSSPKCAAHNFGRNLACIGCGCPKGAPNTGIGGPSSALQQQPNAIYARPPPSPRFNSYNSPNTNVYYTSGPLPHHVSLPLSQPQQQPQQPHSFPTPQKQNHPLLTPSGRAFAVGGRVQNVSSDPLNPCIMYWPDNEAFPEQGQIRPSHVVGVAQPPILNTGNRGPISHQPGDWICQKCNYLNWRRRKVCQTCLPYAEGNGDSISAAVQAERIALLTSVLTQSQAQPQHHQQSSDHLTVPAAHTPRSHSLTPPQVRRPFIDITPLQPPSPLQQPSRSVHRSQSHLTLGQKYANQNTLYATSSSPIYQTSGHRQPSPLYSTGPTEADLKRSAGGAFNVHISSPHDSSVAGVRAPAPLLPSFLQDIVQSPSLSPTSTTTSSVDISSLEEYDDTPSKTTTFNPRVRGNSGSDTGGPISNIWRLDGEESKALSGFPLPRLLAAKSSQERLPL